MTKKEIIIAVVSVGLSAACALTVFAEATTTASAPIDVTAKITCIGAAVNTREQAIDSAMTAYTQSVNSAYSARATALQQAYTQTTLAAVRSARNTAWSDFSKAVKAARKTWLGARNAAWTQYRTTAVACKGPANTGDGINSYYEVSGQ